MSDNQDFGNLDKASRRIFFKMGVQKTVSLAKTQEISTNGVPKKEVLGRSKVMSRRNFVKIATVATVAAGVAIAVGLPKIKPSKDTSLNYKGKVTPADRKVASMSLIKPAGIRPTVIAAPGGNTGLFWDNS
jgi:hypothetical protein